MVDYDQEDALGFLFKIFEQRTPEGGLVYSREDLRHFIPAMLMSLGFDAQTLTPELQALMGDTARKAGVTPEMTPEQTQQKMQAYYEAHPLPPELRFEFLRGLREERIGRGNEDVAEAFGKYMQTTDRKLDGLISEARPEESIPAGPFARFQAPGKLEANKKKRKKR